MLKARLFPNLKQMTTFFSIAIICVTVAAFTLRLTAFSNIVADPVPKTNTPSEVEVEGEETFSYRMNGKVEFASADDKGSFQIENPESNVHYMRVEIIRDDNGKSIYYSGYITPGTTVKTAPLQGDPLEPGTYACTAHITAYDPETRETAGSQQQEITIVIHE